MDGKSPSLYRFFDHNAALSTVLDLFFLLNFHRPLRSWRRWGHRFHTRGWFHHRSGLHLLHHRRGFHGLRFHCRSDVTGTFHKTGWRVIYWKLKSALVIIHFFFFKKKKYIYIFYFSPRNTRDVNTAFVTSCRSKIQFCESIFIKSSSTCCVQKFKLLTLNSIIENSSKALYQMT